MNKNSFAEQDFTEPTGWQKEKWDRQPNESWDQYVIRKMKEEREGKVYPVEVAASGELSSVTPSQPSTAAPQPASASSSESAQSINAPLAGNVFKILVRAGDVVNEGDVVIILEAMKMETEIRSAISGTVSEVLVGEGDAVASAQPLIALG